jgi:dipeptidyl aminopeptidase/acylaminoacyl peptidase
MSMKRFAVVVGVLALLSAGLVARLAGQTESRYLMPPKVVVDILDARPIPTAIVSPSRQQIALVERASMPTIADLAQPMLRLAGTRINPKANGLQRVQGATFAITLTKTADGSATTVVVPPSPVLGSVAFSPDGKRLAFTQTRDSGIDLWITDTATGQSKQIASGLNGTWGAPCDWVTGQTLVCQFVVATRGPAPQPPPVPTGPNVQENDGQPAPVSTYEDLDKNAHDEALFEYYFTSQLAFVDATSGKQTPVGKPGLFEEVSASPNGEYVLVARVKRPFSRLVPAERFPKDVEIWTKSGQVAKKIAEVPSGETVPMLGVITGPRSYRWNPAEPATVAWVEALDSGDLRNKVPFRDKVMALKAPFSGEPAQLVKLENRLQNISWTQTGIALVTEMSRGARRIRTTWLLDGSAAPRKIWELNSEDRYKDPGRPVMKPRGVAAAGGPFAPETGTILQSGDFIYLSGDGASPQGDRPFLDRFNLKTLATERLFQTEGESYEPVVTVLTDDGKSILTRYETVKTPPDYVVRDTATKAKRTITDFKDPAPQLAGVERQFVTYKRKDGVDLSGTLYLPPDYQKGQKVPLIMWAYPREFTDASTAGQVTGSPYRFTTISGASQMLLLTQGYAIFDDPKMPIIGAGETANDTYVEQLVASAEAAVDKVVEMGVTDRDHIGVGGHSYGAFMTANLLAHTRLFRAGVARSGAYNRTLTPFGFQSERRTFWEVPQVYANMSPFWYADKVKDPILLIHGEADNNSGTFPIQSERYYMALKGHGATVRYVTLPLEAHGYAGRESVLHTVAEMINWYDKYVKNAKPRTTSD